MTAACVCATAASRHRPRRLVSTPYVLQFTKDVSNEVICTKQLSGTDLALFRVAIERDTYFQMFFDDLPLVRAWEQPQEESAGTRGPALGWQRWLGS